MYLYFHYYYYLCCYWFLICFVSFLFILWPPTGIVNPATHLHLLSHHNNNNNPIHVNRNHTPLNLTHTSQIGHTTPVTPLSANHSHISFLPGLRPATATPPTPKTHVNANSSAISIARENSGSVTPGTGTLDISNVTSTISPHELSTLV